MWQRKLAGRRALYTASNASGVALLSTCSLIGPDHANGPSPRYPGSCAASTGLPRYGTQRPATLCESSPAQQRKPLVSDYAYGNLAAWPCCGTSIRERADGSPSTAMLCWEHPPGPETSKRRHRNSAAQREMYVERQWPDATGGAASLRAGGLLRHAARSVDDTTADRRRTNLPLWLTERTAGAL